MQIAMLGLFTVLPGGLPAQTVAQRESEEDKGIHYLSPFVINENEDAGYLPTNTLAGTRIRTKISDLGASIAIVTEELMEDLGGTDGESVLIYVGNMEVGGVLGIQPEVVPPTDQFSSWWGRSGRAGSPEPGSGSPWN